MTSHESDLGRLPGDLDPQSAPVSASAAPALGMRRALLLRLARKLTVGEIAIELPSGERLVCAGAPGPRAELQLHRWRALRRLVLGGDLGFAEAYVDGDWSTPDLAAFLTLAMHNEANLSGAMRAIAPLRWLAHWGHRRRRNTRYGSRRNIAAHYDLGNDFYTRWLDRDMNYSSALYGDAVMTLEAAQEAKQARILSLLDLAGSERVLEIGCGWGSLAASLAHRAGSVTALTLSRAQLEFAQARIAAAGLESQVALRLQDYRDVDGRFDRIVSIEMIEAVGEENWPIYFASLRDRLAAGGVAVLQAITIEEPRFATYRRGADFIQRHVFPGGMLLTKSAIAAAAERAGLRLDSMESFGVSYERTLAAWGERFCAAWPEIAAQGFPDRFYRLWNYYLAYCRAGFAASAIDVGLYRLVRVD